MKKKNNETFSIVEIYDMVNKLAEIFEDIPPMKLVLVDKDCEQTALSSDDIIEIKMPEKNKYTLEDIYEMARNIRFQWVQFSPDINTEDTETLRQIQADAYAFANVALWALTDCKIDIKCNSKESEKLYQEYYKSYEEKLFKHIEEKYGYTVIRE